jgi:DNA-binding CsgD family transcriptional regulator
MPAPEWSTPGQDPRVFFRWVQGLALSGDPRLEPAGSVADLLGGRAVAAGAELRRSIWHMTHLPTWPEVRMARGLVERRRRGLDVRYLTTAPSLARLPMLSSHHHPYLRVGPVVAPLLLLDHSVLYVGAPLGHARSGEVWSSTSGPVLGEAVRCFETTWSAGEVAVPPGEEPPFTRRMVDVGFLLTEGASDREIAHRLHVSERTVSAEVAEIVRRLGARSRAHAIALIGGGTF